MGSNVIAPGEATILCTDAPKPFTVAMINGKVVLQLHLSILRLGVASAKWLLEALHVIQRAGSSKQQTLEHNGVIFLTVLSESGIAYIMSTKVRFTMNRRTLDKLVSWLETNVTTNN